MMFGGDPFGIHVQSICNESRSVNATKGQEFQFRTSSFAYPHGWNNRISEPPHPYADFPLASFDSDIFEPGRGSAFSGLTWSGFQAATS
jgi:hypothetical protein